MTLDTRLAPAPVEVVTPIRPSEAIRLGCLKYPVQTFGDKRETGCVVDVMWESMEYDDDVTVRLGALSCPLGCERPGDFPVPSWWSFAEGSNTAAHLNDTHRWSRERIADWLEGLGL